MASVGSGADLLIRVGTFSEDMITTGIFLSSDDSWLPRCTLRQM